MTPRRWTRNIRAWAYRYLVLRDGEQCAICQATPTTPNRSSTTQNENHSRTTPVVSSTTQNTIPTTQSKNNPRTSPIVSSTAQRQLAPRTNRPSKTSSTTRNANYLRATPIVSSTTQNTLDIDHIDGDPKNDNPDNLRLLCRRCNVATSNKSNPRKSYSSDLCVCVRERKEGKPGTRIARDDVDYRRASPEMQANLIYEDTFRRWLLATISAQGFYYRTAAINEGAELIGCSPATTGRYLAKLTSRSGPIAETKDALGHTVLMLKPHLQTPRPKRSQRRKAPHEP